MLKYHLLRCTCIQHSAQDTRYLSDERAWLGRIETMYSVITKRETTAGYKVKKRFEACAQIQVEDVVRA